MLKLTVASTVSAKGFSFLKSEGCVVDRCAQKRRNIFIGKICNIANERDGKLQIANTVLCGRHYRLVDELSVTVMLLSENRSESFSLLAGCGGPLLPRARRSEKL